MKIYTHENKQFTVDREQQGNFHNSVCDHWKNQGLELLWQINNR